MNAALLQPLQALWVDVRERLQPRRLANSSQGREGGGSAIFAAGVVVGNAITFARVVDSAETSRDFSRPSLVPRIIFNVESGARSSVQCTLRNLVVRYLRNQKQRS